MSTAQYIHGRSTFNAPLQCPQSGARVIAALLIWLYQGALFYLYGTCTLTLLSRWLEDLIGERGLALTLVFGMAQVTAVATLLALCCR